MIEKMVDDTHAETQRINRHTLVHAVEHSGKVQI